MERWIGGGAVQAGAESALAWRLVDGGLLNPAPDASSPPIDAAALSIVVAVFARTRELDVCLGCLRRAHREERIVVVDDGSPDPDAIADIASRHGAELIRRPTSGGPAAARNAGLAAVRTPLVAFIDSDVEVSPGWDEPLRPLLLLDRVALVAPRVAAPSGPGLRDRFDAERSPLDLGPNAAAVRPSGRVSYVPAAALVGRTEVVRDLGGFDEDMRVGEDVDLVWRAHEAGWRVRYEPASRVLHREPFERRGPLRWVARRFAYGTSAATLEARHPGAVRPVVISAWSVPVWAAVVSGHPFVALSAIVVTALGMVRKLTGVPWRISTALAVRGHLQAGEQLARAAVRPWWPASLLVACRSRRARRPLLIAVAMPLVLDRHRSGWPRRVPLAPWVGLHLADDAAYGAGVWWGAIRARSVAALLPRSPQRKITT